jgi:hypothetical protein
MIAGLAVIALVLTATVVLSLRADRRDGGPRPPEGEDVDAAAIRV